MNDPQTDAARFFKYASCKRCMAKPCDRLRFGGVYPGKFIVTGVSDFGIGMHDCPFMVADSAEFKELLSNVGLPHLVGIVEEAIMTLSCALRLTYDQDLFVQDYSDEPGRIRFLLALRESQSIAMLRVPFTYSFDSKLSQWLHANESLRQAFEKPEQETSGKK